MLLVLGCVLAAGLLAGYLLHIYADMRHCPWYVLVLVWTTWSLGLLFFFVLPFDLSSTFHARCVFRANMTCVDPEEDCDVEDVCEESAWGYPKNLVTFWSVVYWTSMLLGYFMSDFLRDAIASGAFTIGGRVRHSLRNGAMFYVPFCLLGIVFLVYELVTFKVTLVGLRGYCKAAANAFSLCVVVLMLGYGLVELPRYLWNKGDVEGQLRYLYFRVSEYQEQLSGATERLADALAALERAARLIESAECIGDKHELHELCAFVLAHVEPSERAALEKPTADAAERLRTQPAGSAPLSGLVSVSDLEALNCRVKDELTAYRRSHASYEKTLERAILQLELSELCRKLDDASWDVQRSQSLAPAHDAVLPLARKGAAARLKLACDRRYLRVTVGPALWRTFAACCGVLSLLIIICESTIIFRDVKNLSVISWVLFLDPAGGWLFLSCFSVPLLYNTACVYFAFFRMKLFNFYALHTDQNSDYGSLLFNGTYMCRLAPAITFNYLNLLHEPQRSDESGISPAFLLGLGEMNVVPFLGADYYNDYAPILIVLLCGCTYLNLFSQLASLCGARSFQFDDDCDDELTTEGARIVKEDARRRAAATPNGGGGREAGSMPAADRSEDGAPPRPRRAPRRGPRRVRALPVRTPNPSRARAPRSRARRARARAHRRSGRPAAARTGRADAHVGAALRLRRGRQQQRAAQRQRQRGLRASSIARARIHGQLARKVGGVADVLGKVWRGWRQASARRPEAHRAARRAALACGFAVGALRAAGRRRRGRAQRARCRRGGPLVAHRAGAGRPARAQRPEQVWRLVRESCERQAADGASWGLRLVGWRPLLLGCWEYGHRTGRLDYWIGLRELLSNGRKNRSSEFED